MITNRSLRFAFCALLLLAPLATLAAQDADMMKDDGSFYVSAAYGVALPANREIGKKTVSTDLGFLGGQIGVGYSIFGFRPELSAGYRLATIKDSEGKDSVTSMDLIASVYYDVDTGSEIIPYIGVGGGISNVTVKQADTDKSVLALSFQGAAGIGYAITEDLTLTLGYRLTGAMDADFPEKGGTLKMALGHNVELGIRYSF